ncbi:helix-turn-helix domain-containing protein [Micromonospora sp. NPDC049460]|uniref:helix-turn-helix domain-containing protein n=1 Tax=Micromonospora sp. NPDC049460 TaxID=3364272 RepID=UPI0037B2ECE0
MNTGRPSGDLPAFLRSRRARLTPEDVGITSYGLRRVPGLRREELAQLAGISPTYYMRLEQGQSTNASDAVIDALARALRLTADERAHLTDLARPTRARRRRPPRPEHARGTTIRLLDAMPTVPAVVMGRRTEVLAWNPLGHALLAGHLDPTAPARPADRPNLTRMLFLDPHTRELHRDWHEEACRAVASLRLVAGRHVDDPTLNELVGDLCVRSDEFAALWASHPVHGCSTGRKHLHHPVVGDVDVDFEVLHTADDTGQRLIAHVAADPRSAAALSLLATIEGGDQPRPGQHDRHHSATR